MKVLARILLCLIFTIGLINAGGKNLKPALSPVAKVLNEGFYAGFGLGGMKLSNDYTNESFSSYSVMLLGGYRFNDYLSLEARYYRNLGSVSYEKGRTLNTSDSNFPTIFTNYGLFFKPEYQINNKLSLYLLLGYGEAKLTNIKGADRYEKGFQWGAGASYKASSKTKLFVDYLKPYSGKGFGERAALRDASVDSLSVGINYEF